MFYYTHGGAISAFTSFTNVPTEAWIYSFLTVLGQSGKRLFLFWKDR